ncbi:MAG: hypothetical protein M1820_002852 [Bogoriella megaspora]|nr:MAG: hypothetical protein M1820_002852 [Bogoriella megaspora]
MLVARFFGGFSGSAFLAVAGGTVVDLFNRDEIQFPMVIYAAVQFLGPTLGPAIGGFIVQFSDWRWCYYALLIWSGALLAMIVFFAPETFGLVLLQRKAKDLRVSTGNPQWYHPVERTNRSIARTMVTSCYRPFQMMFLEPICFCMDIYASLLLGILYLSFTAFPVVFGQNHGFNDWQNGMTFVGFLTGMVIAALSDPLWRKNYLRLIRNAQTAEGPAKTPEPEFRLPPGIFGSIITPIGFFWFAWTQFSSVHWIVPIIGSSLFGAGIFLVFNSMFTFLADAYRSYAASALAGNIFCRCCFAAAFSLFGAQMYRNIGFQWASTLLAFLTLAMAPFPFLFFRYGKSLRRNSKFAT